MPTEAEFEVNAETKPDPLVQLTNVSFRDFGAAMAAMPMIEDGSVTKVQHDWQRVLAAKQMLSATASQAADGIETILANPQLLPDQARAIVQQNKQLYDIAERQAVKD